MEGMKWKMKEVQIHHRECEWAREGVDSCCKQHWTIHSQHMQDMSYTDMSSNSLVPLLTKN